VRGFDRAHNPTTDCSYQATGTPINLEGEYFKAKSTPILVQKGKIIHPISRLTKQISAASQVGSA